MVDVFGSIYCLQRWQFSFPWVYFFATLWKLRFPIYFAFGFECSVVVSAGLQREDNQNSSWCDDGPSPPFARPPGVKVWHVQQVPFWGETASKWLYPSHQPKPLQLVAYPITDHWNMWSFEHLGGWDLQWLVSNERVKQNGSNMVPCNVSGGPPRFPKPRPWQGCWG